MTSVMMTSERIKARKTMGYVPYMIKPVLPKDEVMLKKERVQRAGDDLLWSKYLRVDPEHWKMLLEERRVKVEERKKKEALPEKENIDLNFIFSTLKEMEKRNIERHKETVHILTEENKSLNKKLAEFEKKHQLLEEMTSNIKNRVNISLDEDLNQINNNVGTNARSISNIYDSLEYLVNRNLTEIKNAETRIKSKVGGVASSVHAKIRTYPI